jgi:putative phosphoribosyl transferase
MVPDQRQNGMLLVDEDVDIRVDGAIIAGHLRVPERAAGLVIFVHGSGSSRHSPRNQFVATVLNEAPCATLLFDLLTHAEELNRSNVFDIELLARRLAAVAAWSADHPELGDLPTGYFGASTGAAAALWAAADPGCDVAAVVSRGGRPDLTGQRLPAVRAPTLLVVGGHDTVVLDLNRQAQAQMTCACQLSVVPGATHLFEEPGTLQAAAGLARDWFIRHLVGPTRHGRPT